MAYVPNYNDETRRDLERDYRRFVQERFERLEDNDAELAKTVNKTVELLASLVSRVEAMEQRPKEQRALFNSANSGLYTLIALGALVFDAFTTILSVASVVVALIALTHP